MADRTGDVSLRRDPPSTSGRSAEAGSSPSLVAGLAAACVHCGLCLPTCPTYVLWASEADSPRGRVLLARTAAEDDVSLAPVAVHFDRCLGCMACLTSCPSGVRYDLILEHSRSDIEAAGTRSRAERAWRWLLLALLTHPRRLRAVAPATAAVARLALADILSPRLRRTPRLAALTALAAAAGARRRRAGPPRSLLPARTYRPETQSPGLKDEVAPGRSAPGSGVTAPGRGRVALLAGCAARVLFSEVNQAAARVLRAEGFEVATPAAPRCCGALAHHSGLQAEALRLARRTVDAFSDFDLVVTTAAGCGAAMKGYGDLLAADPRFAGRARILAAKVRDVTEVLSATEPVATRHPLPLRVAYHDACHLAHAQRVRREPRRLLSAVPGLVLVEPSEWEVCCGSAGLYNLLQPSAAASLGERKARALLDTGAEAIVAGNPGCALQIAVHLRALRHPLPILHPVELLDASIRGLDPGLLVPSLLVPSQPRRA